LLLLHGNRQSIASFSYQIPAFAKYFRVIAVDTGGRGSPRRTGRHIHTICLLKIWTSFWIT
jgi:hypothetical protein